LNLKCDFLVSKFAFKFNLYCYNASVLSTYSLFVGYAASVLTLLPSSEDVGATIGVASVEVLSVAAAGGGTFNVTLPPGPSTTAVIVSVTAADGVTQGFYTVVVTRAAPPPPSPPPVGLYKLHAVKTHSLKGLIPLNL
jgi:hypothetical protein